MKAKRTILMLIFWGIFTTCEQNKALDAKKEIDYCVQKTFITTQSEMEEGFMPRNIGKGQKKWNLTRISNWTAGYYSGILWNIYDYTGDAYWKNHAQKYTQMLVPEWKTYFNRQNFAHSLMLSFGNGYAATGDSSYYQILMRAADLVHHDLLQETKNEKSGLNCLNILSEKAQSPFLNHILNYQLLFWAAHNGKPDYYATVLKAFDSRLPALDGRNKLFEKKGSNVFSSLGTKKKMIKNHSDLITIQPVVHFSWMMYACAFTYRETQEKKYLMIAEKMADIFLKNLPKDHIPGWSFDKSTPGYSIKDASAATVSASALLQLFSLSENENKNQYFRKAASILTTLSSGKYKSNDSNQAFLLHSVGTNPQRAEANVSLIYTDYYYLEALLLYDKIVEGGKGEIIPLISQIN